MMPWKEQVRLGWAAVRWVLWPVNMKAWANIAAIIDALAVIGAIGAQLWLVLLAAFFLWYPITHYGRRP